MIVTTTETIQGRNIIEYKGLVFGEVISGIDFVKDMFASFTNFFGGRSEEYEQEMIQTREGAIQEMIRRAQNIGANAIVGVSFDTEFLGRENNMLMITVSGTAVFVQ